MSVLFADSINPEALDPNQTEALYYFDGRFANEAAVRERCPHAILFAITVLGATGVHIAGCDCELGDMSVDAAISWVEEQIRLNAPLIIVYANADRWHNQGLEAALAKYGNRIKRYIADYDGVAEIPAGFDAKQYAGDVPGENGGTIDRDIALDTFLTPYEAVNTDTKKKTPPKVKPSGIVVFEGSVNVHDDRWEIHQLPGTAHYGNGEDCYTAEVQLTVEKGGDSRWSIRGVPDKHKFSSLVKRDVVPAGIARFGGTFNLGNGHWTIHHIPGTAQLGINAVDFDAKIILTISDSGKHHELKIDRIERGSAPLG